MVLDPCFFFLIYFFAVSVDGTFVYFCDFFLGMRMEFPSSMMSK